MSMRSVIFHVPLCGICVRACASARAHTWMLNMYCRQANKRFGCNFLSINNKATRDKCSSLWLAEMLIAIFDWSHTDTVADAHRTASISIELKYMNFCIFRLSSPWMKLKPKICGAQFISLRYLFSFVMFGWMSEMGNLLLCVSLFLRLHNCVCVIWNA